MMSAFQNLLSIRTVILNLPKKGVNSEDGELKEGNDNHNILYFLYINKYIFIKRKNT